MGDNLFTLTWWIKEDSANVNFDNDDLIRGDGFRVQWSTGFTLFLDQYNQDVPLRDWLDRNATGYFRQADWSGDNLWHKWKVEYDYRTTRITHYAANGTTVLNVLTQWQDNVTERLGTNAATTVFTNSLATMSNVVVQHFVSPRKNHYVSEGIVGHSASRQYGDIHKPWWPIKKMVVGGSNLFYTCEYNEGNYQIQMFSPTDPQLVLTNFSYKTLATPNYADYGLLFTNLAIQTNAIFAAGNTFTRYFRVANTNADTLETVIYDGNGVPQSDSHGLTKLTGSSPTNFVLFCMADSTGSLPGQLSKTQPYFLRVSNDTLITLHTNAMGALFNSNRANLLVTNANRNWLNIRGLIYVYSITNFVPLGTNNSYFPAEYDASAFDSIIPPNNRIAVATNPVDGKIAVFDKSTEQVRIFSGTNLVLTIGTNGGYANGPFVPFPVTSDTNFAKIVKLGSYYDDHGVRVPRATVCYQPDGKLWVSDSPTCRMLRFNSDGSLDTLIETVTHSYRVSVDPNNANRVFANYLEFQVDHSRPFVGSWVLNKYWGHDVINPNGVRTNFVADYPHGFQSVVTITNWGGTNRTFAHRRQDYRLVELTDSGMKEMHCRPTGAWRLSQRVDLPKESAGPPPNEFKNFVLWSVI